MEFDDEVVLQLHGVPVAVNPEVMIIANTEAATNFGENIRMGPDDVTFKKSLHHKELPKLEDNIVLQVWGVPITVNPESMIVANTEAAVDLGLTNMVLGPDDISVVQKKATKDLDDKEMKDSISQFNLKLVELKKKFNI